MLRSTSFENVRCEDSSRGLLGCGAV